MDLSINNPIVEGIVADLNTSKSLKGLHPVEILRESGYNVSPKLGNTAISKPISIAIFWALLSSIIGVMLCLFWVSLEMHFGIVIIGALFIGLPIVYDRLKFPNKIMMNVDRQKISLRSGLTYFRSHEFSEINGFVIDAFEANPAFDNKYTEGHKEFIYEIYIQYKTRNLKFAELSFSEPMDREMDHMLDYFNNFIKMNEPVQAPK